MIKQKAFIGKELDCKNITLEKSLVTQMYQALKNPNPYFLHDDTEIDFSKNTQVPLAFLGTLINLPKIYKALDLNIKNILLSRETITSHHFINIGDTLLLRSFLRDAYEQQASSTPIGFIILTTFAYKNTDFAFLNEKILAIRGGFNRSKIK